MRPSAWPFLVCLLTACDSSPGSSADLSTSAAAAFRALASRRLDVDAAGQTPMLYPSPLFDGTHLWVTYNRPDGSNGLDVYLTAFSADGSIAVAPTQLDQSTDNEIQPTIALSSDTLLVAWAADTGQQPTNLYTRARLVDLSGAPRGDVLPIVPTRKGLPNAASNIWRPRLTSDANGFVLLGTWGIDEAPAFQAYATRLGIDGTLGGDAIDLGIDVAGTQDAPSGVVVDGTLRAAWQNEQNASDDVDVRATTVAPGGTTAATPTTIAIGGRTPSISASGGKVWGAWMTPAKVEVGPLDGAAPTMHLDGALAPTIAADTLGGAVAYYTNGSGLRVTQFDDHGARVRDLDVAPKVSTSYPIGLARIADGLFCVTWADGQNPALSSHAMILDFSVP